VEIKISAKAFAEFVLGSPSKKASTVRFLQKPESTAAQIVVRYYSRAIQIIRSYHDAGNNSEVLKAGRKELLGKLQEAETQQAKTKLLNNLRALDAYMEIFGERNWNIVPFPRIYHIADSVRVSATPDFVVREGARLRLVKLGVRKETENPEVIRIMLRVMYQAACEKFPKIKPQDVTFFDVGNRLARHGSKNDSSLAKAIEDACLRLKHMVLGMAA